MILRSGTLVIVVEMNATVSQWETMQNCKSLQKGTMFTNTAVLIRYDWPQGIPVTDWLAGSEQEVASFSKYESGFVAFAVS